MMSLERMEERIGELLGIGTAISSVLLTLGLVLWIALGPAALASWLLYAGLIVLIVTPIGRVIASAVGFAMQHDRQMFVLTLLVLASLLMSLVVAVS
jgi:uncharacterized membrane protein